MKQRLKTMKNINKNSLSISGLCLILLTVLFAFSQARAQGGSIVVNTLADGDDTACNAANCTLREAVKYSPAGSTITFSVTGIIQLVGFTELVINKNLTIAGPGADSLTVKAGVGYIAGIFDIRGGIVNISGLKLSDGKGKEISTYNPSTGVTTRQNLGGAIYIAGGTVTLTSCTLSNNRATNGGAIYVRDGSLAVTGSTISGNDSGAYSYGGGIQVRNGSLAVASSTISGNIAGYGGGLDISGGTATIENSTISGNTAREYWEQRQGLYYSFNGRGGGMYIGAGTVTVTNSTISGNIAEGTNEIQGDGGGRRQIGYEGGGGILNAGVLTVANSTITNNYAVTGAGGGINTYNSTTTMQLSNSILANNTSGGDLTRTASGNYNLVQDASYGTLTGTNNITGQDALLGPLANNGGPTQTHALLAGSPAINAGDPNFNTANTPYDQRGIGYARKSGSAIDIGAFEVQPPPAAADLTIAKSHTGSFTQGDTGKTYSIIVTNIGGTATSGTVTVTDTLPQGLTATGIDGTGWTCTLATLTCTRTDALAAAGSYPAITVTVNVAANAPASVTNTATVSGGGETNTTNNTATDATTINAAATYSISGQVIYGTTPSASAARGVPGVMFNASGTPSATATSNLSGIYQLSGLGSGAYTVTPSKSGDVNHITANDALLIQQYGAYAANLTANQLIAADTSNDNQVNTTDALYIQQYLAYVNTQAPNIIEQWKFLPALRNYTLNGNLANQNYTAVLVGEVDGDWVAPGGTSSAPQQAASATSEPEDAAAIQTNADETNATDINVNQLGIEKTRLEGKESIKYSSPSAAETTTAAAAAVSSVTVSLPTGATASTGTSITIPITVSQLPALTDTNVVRTYAFNVQYDASVLQFTGADTTGTLSNSGVVCGQPPADPTTTNRIVACNYTNLNGITGQGTLLKLNFTVIGTSGQQSALTFVGTARQPSPFIFNTGDPQAVTNNGSFTVTGTTAATVSLSGRVMTASGRGIVNVNLYLTDSNGQVRSARTTSFGYYRFDDVQVGETYILSAVGKRYTFSQPSQVLNINEETDAVNFIADSK